MTGGKPGLPPDAPPASCAAVQSTGPENGDYAAFARRVVKGLGRRVGDGDLDALPDLLKLERLIESEARTAVFRLRAAPHFYSNQQIADCLTAAGLGPSTREAVRVKWKQPADMPGRSPGGQPVDRR